MSFSMRNATSDDWPFIQSLYAQDHVRTQMPRPIKEQFLRSLHQEGRFDFIIEEEGAPFGNLRMDRPESWLVTIGAIAILEPRRGAGRFALTSALSFAFDELKAHRVFLEIVESNVASRELCERAGFQREGLYRDGYRDETGAFHNLIPYGMLAADAAAL